MGIIDGTPLPAEQRLAEQEADTLFTCVFLGLLADGFEHGWPLRWDVEPDSDIGRIELGLEELRNTLRPLADHVSAILRAEGRLAADAGVEVGTSPAHWYAVQTGRLQPRDSSAVALGIRADRDIGTGHAIRQQRTTSPALETYIVDSLIGDLSARSDDPASGYQDLLRSKTDSERGAYYGIVDHPDNVPPKVLSSVRRLIPYADEYGRWRRGLDYHGLIGYDQAQPPPGWRNAPKQAGSFEPTRMIGEWDGRGCVCGYCHGMNWSIAQAACMYPPGPDGEGGGVAFELGLGEHTLKLASCFGCTTFMYANGLAPSSAHLGRAESWVPLPEDEDSAGVFFNENGHTRDLQAIRATFQTLNQRWADKVARWMIDGASLIGDHPMFADWARAHVARLLERVARMHAEVADVLADQGAGAVQARHHRLVANLFLDALTVHKRDLDRLRGITAA